MEALEQDEPNFVENIIGSYLSQSALFLDELQQTLETKPLNLETVYRLIQKLRGGSATFGAGKFNGIVEEMWTIFKAHKTDRLYAAYEKVRAGHATLRLQLEPYAELLHLVRDDVVVPDEASEIVDMEDNESVDSNDLDE